MTHSGGWSAMTLEEVSLHMHITRERVRQIQERALGKLFKKMWAIYPEADAFEVMALILVGTGVNKKGYVRAFYHAFPKSVKRMVYTAAFKHAPYMEKIDNRILKEVLENEENGIDIEKETE